jgi:hypothetical protein
MNLSNQSAIQTNFFVRMDIPDYAVLRFSDFSRPYTINGESYAALGQLMGISNGVSEMRASGQEVNITITGIPGSNISDVLTYRYKGSEVIVYRGVFNPTTGQILTGVGTNPSQRFKGIITNFGITEQFERETRSATNTIVFTCASDVLLLENKVSGRRTNPTDQKTFYPNDLAMDRVPNLVKSQFQFGAPAQ